MTTEAFLFIYLIAILWIELGGVVGYFVIKSPMGVMIMSFLFGMVGFLVFPGLWEAI